MTASLTGPAAAHRLQILTAAAAPQIARQSGPLTPPQWLPGAVWVLMAPPEVPEVMDMWEGRDPGVQDFRWGGG